MTPHPLASSPCGQLVAVKDGQRAFVPAVLPRRLTLSGGLVYRLDEASRAVAMLAGIGETIPNPHLLIRPFVRREAVLSSRIEGTQASLADLFLYEASGMQRPKGDVVEVMSYVRALEHGLRLLDKLPVSRRLISEIHKVLLEGVRGQEKRPGEFRNDIVWIGSEGTSLGEARYIPPPASHVADLMGDLEKFANEELELPPLVQCALLHYQFEAIHPYFDGNGRTGRLLITLFLAWKRVLPKPLLYLSAYFERGRQMYYDQLFNVSRTGDWEAWLTYFFQGVTEQAYDAIDRIRRVRALQDDYRQALQARHETANALHLVDELFSTPFVQIGDAAQKLHVSHAGARGILERLKEMGIVEEVENQWPRLYVARKLLKVVEGGPNEGT